MRSSYLCLNLLFLVSGCEKKEFVPERPTGMPIQAEYVGGVDGGVWMSCKPINAATLNCIKYNEKTGEDEYKMQLKVCLNVKNKNDHFEVNFSDDYRFIAGNVSLYRTVPDEYIPVPGQPKSIVFSKQELALKAFSESAFEINCQEVN